MTSTIVIHVVSNCSRNGVDVGVTPNFQMEASEFEYATTCYGDIMIVSKFQVGNWNVVMCVGKTGKAKIKLFFFPAKNECRY